MRIRVILHFQEMALALALCCLGLFFAWVSPCAGAKPTQASVPVLCAGERRLLPPHPKLPPELRQQMLRRWASESRARGPSARPVRDRGRSVLLASPLTGFGGPLVSGTKQMPCVLIQFPDLAATYSVAHFQNLLFVPGGVPTGSVRDYYLENSYGLLSVAGTVVGWYQTNQPRIYYGDARGGAYSTRCAYEAAQQADAAGMNWAPFDNDGDGYVDLLWVVHSGLGAEESGSGYDIHSHHWSFSGAKGADPTFPGVFVTSTPDPRRPGQKIKIDDYMIVPELSMWAGGGGKATTLVGIGVFCHEFGHALGLPDLYDTGGNGEGLGFASLMAIGSYGGNGSRPDSRFPAHLDAWSKTALGWLNPTPITANTRATLQPVESTPSCYLVKPASSTLGEYFLVENRQRVGFDRDLYDTGLFIYHVDEAIIQRYRATNQVNVNTHPYGVALEEADAPSDDYRAMDLFVGRNWGNAGDAWPNGSRQGFSPYSVPSVRSNAGEMQDCAVTPIPPKSSAMTVNFFVQGTRTPDAFEPDDTSAAARFLAVDGPKQSHSLLPAGDVDWVRFEALAGETYVIQTSAPSNQPPLNTLVRLYDASGTTLLDSNGDGGTPPLSRLEWTCPSSGTYTVCLSSPNPSEIGFYEVGVASLPGVVTATATSLAPATAIQGQTGVPMLRLRLAVNVAEARITALKVDETGTSTQAGDVARICVHRDANGNGVFDVGVDTLVGSAVPTSQSTWVPFLSPQSVTAADGATFFVVYDVGLRAQVGMTLGASLVEARSIAVQEPDVVSPTGFPLSSTATQILAAPIGPPDRITLSSVPTSLVADGASTATITAQVEDAHGNAVLDGTLVLFTVDKGATITPSAPTASGQATALLRSGTEVGTATVTATSGSAVATLSVPFLPGPPAAVWVAADKSSLTADGASTTQITATVKDTLGRPVADGTVVLFGADMGTIGARATTQDGKATVIYTSGTVSGSATVMATAGGVTGSVTLTLLPGAPATITMSASTSTLPADGVATATITALVTDAHGNKVADGTVVTFAVDRGTITPSATTTGGQATALFTAGEILGTVTVTATAGSATGTLRLTLAAGPPASVRIVAEKTSVAADGASTVGLIATVLDAKGNPVSDGTVVFFRVDNGTITESAATTDGQASAVYIAGTKAGTATITATAGDVTGTATIALQPGAPSTLSLVAAQTTLVADGTSATSVTATVTDAHGNAVANGTVVTFTTNSGRITPSVATVDGKAVATYTAPTTAGSAQITAVANGHSQFIEITLVAGTPTEIALWASQSILVADGKASTQVTATVADAYGNRVAGAMVVFQTDRGTIAPSTATTDAVGVASATLTAPVHVGIGTVTATCGGARASLEMVYRPGEPAKVVVAVSADRVLANGGSTLQVTATVTDANGNPVADGTPVTFSADRGGIEKSLGLTKGGEVTVTYRAPSAAQNSTVRLTAHSGEAMGTASVALVAPAWLAGRVNTPEGIPTGATLDLIQNGQVVTTMSADSEGWFHWSGQPGLYDVVLRAPGYVPVIRRGVDLQKTDAEGFAPQAHIVMESIRQPTFAPGQHLVTFPFAFPGASNEVVTGDPQPPMACWMTEWKQYRFGGEPGFPCPSPGVGYWLQCGTNPVVITQPGEPADPRVPVRLRLRPGWNLMGNPFWRPVPVYNLAVSVDGAPPVPLNAPEAAGAVRDYLWTYDPTRAQYRLVLATSSQMLAVWQGFWIRALKECELVVSPPGDRATRSPVAQRVPKPTSRATCEWRVRLVAITGDLRDEENFFGLDERATQIEAPPPLQGYVDVRFLPMRADTGSLASDIRAGEEGGAAWRIEVITDLPDRLVTLQWPDAGRLPPGVNLLLIDEATGARRRMRTSGGYSFAAQAGVPRRFRIEREQSGSPLRIADVEIHPAGRGGRVVAYTLSAPADVTVEVLSPSGRRVRLVAGHRPSPQGRSEVVFDGRDDRGVCLASGVYLVQVTAGTEEGALVRAMRPFVWVR